MLKKSFPKHLILIALSFIGISYIDIPKTVAKELPKAQCLSAYGETKCGYHCLAAYGEVKCAEWPGGACQAAYGEIACGPPAPTNWLDLYTNQSGSNNSQTGIYGAWAVRSESGNWNGILRMRGSAGTLVYVSNLDESVEMKMTLKRNPNGGYLLEGQYMSWHNLKHKYLPDSFYFQNFGKNFSVNACNRNQNCRRTTLTYLGK